MQSDSDKRGWGTIILLSLFGLFSISMVILIVLSLLVPPVIDGMVEAYTDLESVPVPVVALTDSERDEIESRLETFGDALKEGQAVGPLVLNEREINGLLFADDEVATGYVNLEEGTIRAQMSVPIRSDLELGPWRAAMDGRFINGVAELDIGIEGDILTADLVSFEVNGEDIPGWLHTVLQTEIDDMEWLSSEDVREVVADLEYIEFRDGRLIVHPN